MDAEELKQRRRRLAVRQSRYRGMTYVQSAVASSVPTYGAAGVAATGAGAIVPAMPAGLAVDQVLLLCVNNCHTATVAVTLSDAQGFVAVTGGAMNSGDDSGVRSQQTLFWRRYDGTGTAPTVADNGEENVARIYSFTGCVTSGDPYEASVGTTADIDNDDDLSLNGPTTTVANTIVCAFVTAFVQATGASLGSWTNAALTNITERDDTAYSVAGEDIHMALTTGTKATAGAVGSTTTVWTGKGAYVATAGIVIALKPA